MWASAVVSLVAIVAIAAGSLSWVQSRKAVAATKKTSEAASRGNVSLARYVEEGGNNAQALAYLAQALRLTPENRNASGFTAALLTQLSSPVPLTGSMRHHGWVYLAPFSPNGQRVVTALDDQTAALQCSFERSIRLSACKTDGAQRSASQ
jgi:hypothetical protein